MPNIHAIPAFNDNYIWLLQHGQQAAVVDPGDAAPVLAYLQAEQLTLTDILITHHHYDHTGGIEELVQHTGAKTYGPTLEVSQALSQRLSDGDRLYLPHLKRHFDILAIPGHTRGHIAFYEPGLVFCGDTLFAGGCGRIFEGTAEDMYHSLQKLAALPDDTLIYCTHEYTVTNLRFAQTVEPDNLAIQQRLSAMQQLRAENNITLPSTIAIEKATNPFLRATEPAVIAHAQQHNPTLKPTNVVAVFATIRQLKDKY